MNYTALTSECHCYFYFCLYLYFDFDLYFYLYFYYYYYYCCYYYFYFYYYHETQKLSPLFDMFSSILCLARLGSGFPRPPNFPQ